LEGGYRYEHLLHLIAVSFSIQLAYVALPWFRYGRRILEDYKDLCARIGSHGIISEDVKGLLDKEIRENIDPIVKRGLGVRAFFGTATKKGIDTYFVKFLLIITAIELLYISSDCTASIWTHVGLGHLALLRIIIFTSVVGMGVPMASVWYGNSLIRLHQESIRSIEKRANIPSPWDDTDSPTSIDLIENTLKKSQDLL
jgi:hypothetical protein